VRAKRVILATGAIERHMVFPNNDRPGIMLASAARMFLNQYGVAVGQKVGVYTAHDSAYEAAFDLKRAGVEIAAIVDCRRRRARQCWPKPVRSASTFWPASRWSTRQASCGCRR
jgi:NADPH-dependent 2,4-dienoyl-CoA reductase/sulfur reductase-like enzyme